MSKSVQLPARKRCEFNGSRPKNHISGYIFGTGSRHHNPFTLYLWPYFSFQTSLRLSKSVQPYLRKRCEFSRDRSKSHFFDYISGTESCSRDPFTLDLWPHFRFQTSLRLSKSVPPSSRKRCEFNGSRPKNHISGHISGTGSRRHNPFTLVQCPCSTFRMSLRLSKSVQPSSRKRCEFNGSRPKNHISGYISGTEIRHYDPFTLYLWPYISFQTSLKLSKSVELSPRNRCEFNESRSKNHISSYISGTGNFHHDPFTLGLWPHFSFQTSPRLSKSVQPSPRKRCEFNGSRPNNHISGYISGTKSHCHNPFALV